MIGTTPRKWCYLWIISPQWKRILAYYGHRTRPVRLSSLPDQPIAYAPTTVTGTVVFDPTKWTRRRQRVGSLVTLNDLFIAAVFNVLAESLIEAGTPLRHWYRVAMPIDQRDATSPPASACNRTSMVYLDRRLRDCGDLEVLLTNIAEETARIKTHRLGTVLSDVLKWIDRIPYCIAVAVADRRCAISTVLSNLGRIEPIAAGDAVLTPTQFVVPRRPGTNLSVGVVTVDDQIHFCAHYDRDLIPQIAAERIVTTICERVADYCGETADHTIGGNLGPPEA